MGRGWAARQTTRRLAMYLALCNSLVREHVERLRDEASRARLAARVERGPGVWATVRGASRHGGRGMARRPTMPRERGAGATVAPVHTPRQGARMIKLLLADARPEVRRGLRMWLSLQPDVMVVGETGSGDELLALVREQQPDVVVLD